MSDSQNIKDIWDNVNARLVALESEVFARNDALAAIADPELVRPSPRPWPGSNRPSPNSGFITPGLTRK